MQSFSHEDQRRIWEEEHKKPQVLLQMDSEKPSSGVQKFWTYLVEQGCGRARGIEMGCGKGRNVIGLAKEGVEMHGFDFSPSAIEEARSRAERAGASTAHFKVQDATETWDYESDSFDFGIDCFATTDIESAKGRAAAVREMYRVLKPGGLLLAYLLSTDDEFHKEMVTKQPAHERNAFHHSTGKFERTFDQGDIDTQYGAFETVVSERVEKTAEFFGKDYACRHFWVVLRKPLA